MACELALMGCQVTLVEKRSSDDAFNRFNVLHLWEYGMISSMGIPERRLLEMTISEQTQFKRHFFVLL